MRCVGRGMAPRSTLCVVQEQAEAAAASTFSGSASEKPAASAAEAAAAAAAASEAASGRLRLLSGDATGQKWVVRADAATGAVAWLLPLRAVCAAVRASPLLLKNGAGPNLAVRALLMGQPLLAKLPAKTLDALSFAFNLLSHAQGALLTTEGIAAPRLHILLSGSAAMRRRRAEPRRGSRLLSWLGQEDAEVAGGAGGGGGGRGGGGGGGGGAAGAAGRSDEASAESWPGDALGVRSIFGGASVEPATATARGTNTLTLTIDRSAALSLLPRDVASALRGRPDPLTLGEASAKLGLPSGLIMERVIARGARHRCAGRAQHLGRAIRRQKVAALVEPPPLRRQILIERAALSAMSHPCICQLAGTYKTAICLYLVLELCDGPELYNVLQDDGPLAEASICSYGAEIVCALGALHERAWLYRDVKAENLVFTSHGHLKLVDLGLARRLPYGGRCFTVCGSSEYMAPEVVRQTGGYDFSADWWGVGCLLYEMRFTHTPWVVGDHGEVDATLTDNEISRNILDAARAVAFPPPPKDGTPLSEQLGGCRCRPRRLPRCCVGCSFVSPPAGWARALPARRRSELTPFLAALTGAPPTLVSCRCRCRRRRRRAAATRTARRPLGGWGASRSWTTTTTRLAREREEEGAATTRKRRKRTSIPCPPSSSPLRRSGLRSARR